MSRKEYLGDGAYVEFDGYGLMLTAEDGAHITNQVYLEPAVYDALTCYVARLKEADAEREPDLRDLPHNCTGADHD